MRRFAKCKTCRSPIFKFFRRGWFHADGKQYACAVQNAVGYHPHAEPEDSPFEKPYKPFHSGLTLPFPENLEGKTFHITVSRVIRCLD